MRIVPRLTVVLVGAMAVLLGWRGYVQVERDAALFESDMRRDHRIVGDVLRTSLAAVLLAEDEDRGQAIVAMANAPTVDATATNHSRSDAPTFTWLHGAAVSRVPVDVASEPQRIVSDAPEGRACGPVRRFFHACADGHEALVTWLPVRPDDPTFGVLEIRESLAERDRHIASDVRYTVLELLAGIAVACGLAFALSKLLVGRPIDALVERARRIGEGDLEETGVEGPEELRLLSAEMNAMCRNLSQARARLVAEGEERLRALDQLRHADRLATVGKLAAGIAHELGTPLAVVAGHAQMIAEREVEGDGVTRSARVIEQQVHRSARIIRQLLDFARARTSARGEDAASSDVRALAAEATAVLEPLAQKRGVKLLVAGEDACAAIAPERLQQVVTNLLVNAIHAVPQGGTVEVDVCRDESPHPERGGARPWVRIDVRDSGAGIAEDVLPRIFEPFFTTKEMGEGTGLGLSVVHGIVRDHGGFIDVTTALGCGTTFSVHLEAAR